MQASKTNARQRVAYALKRLSPRHNDGGFFVQWFSATRVAADADCGASTARKYLEELSQCRGFLRRNVRGVIGYRFLTLGA